MQHLEEGTIHAWIDGALSAAEARDVESHLATCEPCAQLAAEARGLVAASSRILTALDDVPGDVIPIAVPPSAASATPGVTPIQSVTSKPRFTPFWMRTAAAVLVIAGTSALVMTGKLNSPETKSVALTLDTAAAPSEVAALEQTLPLSPDSIPPSGGSDLATPRTRSAATVKRAPASGAVANQVPASQPQANRSAPPPAAIATAPTIPDPRVAGSQTADRQLQDRQAQQQTAAREEALTQERERLARAETDSRRIGATSGSLATQQPAKSASSPADTRSSSLATPQAAPRNRDVIASTAAAASAVVGAAADAVRKRTGATPTAGSAEARSASGCYALSLSPWSGGTIPFGAPPPRIELDTIRNSLGELLVHPARGTASNGAPRAYWTQDADSVFIIWRDEARGVRLSLPASGEVLRGRAETIPGGSAAQSSVVEATRINCRQ